MTQVELANLRLQAYKITNYWHRIDGGKSTIDDKKRWANELVDWSLEPDPRVQPEPPTEYTPDLGMRIAAA